MLNFTNKFPLLSRLTLHVARHGRPVIWDIVHCHVSLRLPCVCWWWYRHWPSSVMAVITPCELRSKMLASVTCLCSVSSEVIYTHAHKKWYKFIYKFKFNSGYWIHTSFASNCNTKFPALSFLTWQLRVHRIFDEWNRLHSQRSHPLFCFSLYRKPHCPLSVIHTGMPFESRSKTWSFVNCTSSPNFGFYSWKDNVKFH